MCHGFRIYNTKLRQKKFGLTMMKVKENCDKKLVMSQQKVFGNSNKSFTNALKKNGA